METVEVYLGIRDLMNKDAREVHRDKVPPVPKNADHWVPNYASHVVFDFGDQRWRYDNTGDLLGYYRYRKRGGDIEEFWCNE